MCVLLFGLGGLLVNPIVDVGDRLVKGCFGGFVVFGIYRSAISAPNGRSASLAILNDCNPNGIPIMEMHRISPTNAHPIAMANPPRMIHGILPRTRMICPFPIPVDASHVRLHFSPDIMTETRDATLGSPLIHPRTAIQAERMR